MGARWGAVEEEHVRQLIEEQRKKLRTAAGKRRKNIPARAWMTIAHRHAERGWYRTWKGIQYHWYRNLNKDKANIVVESRGAEPASVLPPGYPPIVMPRALVSALEVADDDRLKAALKESRLLYAAIDKEVRVLESYIRMCFGGLEGDEWDDKVEQTIDWADIAWSITERLRKAAGRPQPCDFCHGAGFFDVDLGCGTEELDCRACDGLGDGEPWVSDE